MMTSRHSVWNLRLPLFDAVVFVDWNGVMSTSLFWETYTRSGDLLSQSSIQRAVAQLFSNDVVVGRWMRGAISTEQIVNSYLIGTEVSMEQRAILHATLVAECESARTDHWMAACVRLLRERYHVVLATDNMDCFVNGINVSRDLSLLFDDFISSSEVGVLKSERPEQFFGPWLDYRNIDVTKCFLIDDSPANCAAFERLGGKSILYRGDGGRLSVMDLVWPDMDR